MKNLSNAMLEYLASDSAQLCSCWQILLVNGTVMGFTDSDADQTFQGVKYKAATGFTRSNITTPVDLSTPNLNVIGVLNDVAITDNDIRAGLYDYAEVFIFAMVPGDIGADRYGIIKLRRGWLGQVTLTDGQHETEVRGLAQLLSQNFIELYTLDCQADFGDARCKFDLATVTDTGTVTAVTTPQRAFQSSVTGSRANGFYNFGTVTWNTGRNKGLTMEVRSWDTVTFTLYLPMGYPIQVGDTFSATAGCDKSFATCISKFSNSLNFRGFPYIPGLDTTIYPNAAQAVPTSI